MWTLSSNLAISPRHCSNFFLDSKSGGRYNACSSPFLIKISYNKVSLNIFQILLVMIHPKRFLFLISYQHILSCRSRSCKAFVFVHQKEESGADSAYCIPNTITTYKIQYYYRKNVNKSRSSYKISSHFERLLFEGGY